MTYAVEARSGSVTRVKGKSMITEEVGLNHALESKGFEVVETDVGEYIIQLANEPPSHIVGPAVHKSKRQVAELFYEHHRKYGKDKLLDDAGELVKQARGFGVTVFHEGD